MCRYLIIVSILFTVIHSLVSLFPLVLLHSDRVDHGTEASHNFIFINCGSRGFEMTKVMGGCVCGNGEEIE